MLRDTSGQDVVLQPKTGIKPMWLAFGAVAMLVAIVLFTFPAMSSLFSADMTVSKERLRFAVVERGDLQRDLSVQGRIVASNSPTLYARSPGIISLVVKAGDTVKEGEPLATIDSPELNNRYQQELAVLEQQKIEVGRYKIQVKTEELNSLQAIEQSSVDLNAAEVNKRRAELSIDDKLISQREYETTVATFEKAKLTHKHAMQQLELKKESDAFELQSRESRLARQQFVVDDLNRQIQDLQLVAPASGIIGSVNVREQDRVEQGAPLITLIDLSAFEVEVSIPENYADDLGVGLNSEISFNGSLHNAEIIAISPEVNNGQVIGRLKFSNNTASNLRQNQRVTARILIESKENILKVRRGAFVESGGGRMTYLVKGNIATRTNILLGARSLAEVEVLQGLAEGDRILISGLDDIKQQEHIYISN